MLLFTQPQDRLALLNILCVQHPCHPPGERGDNGIAEMLSSSSEHSLKRGQAWGGSKIRLHHILESNFWEARCGAEQQAEKGSTQPHGIFLPLPLSPLSWSFSPTSSPWRCLPLSPCCRLQNGTRLFPSQPAAVTQRRQPAAGARSEPTLSFRMTHWNLALIDLFLAVDGEQPKSYTGLDQGKRLTTLFSSYGCPTHWGYQAAR